MFGSAVRGTFGREFAECANAGSIWSTAGCVSRDTARGGNCGTTLGRSEKPIGGGTRCTIGIAIGGAIGGATRWGIGVATAGLTRCAIGGVTTEGVTGCVTDGVAGGITLEVIGGVTSGGVPRWGIGGAAGAACGFSTKMRSRHLGHRMHAPFAPFSNASFRRYSVMQELHRTTMTMAHQSLVGNLFLLSGEPP